MATRKKKLAAKPKKKKNLLKVFVNTYPDTTVEIHEWKLSRPKGEPDPARVDVQTDDLCYSIVLDALEPRVETWEVGSQGELKKEPLATFGLPFIESVEELQESKPDNLS